MITYLIKSTLCLLLLLLVYRVLLAQETMYRFNRYFLLFSMIFGLTIPLLTLNLGGPIKLSDQITEINTRLDKKDTSGSESISSVTTQPDRPVTNSENNTNSFSLLWIIYWVGVIIITIKFLRNIRPLYSKIKNSPRDSIEKTTLILTNDGSKPHSFFSYVFVDQQLYESGQIDHAILQHELTHTRQWHSLDILFIEILKIAFWFNPVLYFYKKAIRTNHEYLADAAALAKHGNTTSYQRLLLKMKSPVKNSPLTSNISFSITKKRIIMMSKNSSRWITSGKKLALIPVLAALIFTFSTRTTTAQNVQQMSLTELINAVSERMDAMESLSDQEQRQLRNLLEKMQQKLQTEKPAPPPPPAKKLKEQNVLQIHVNKEGLILINEEPVPLDKVASKVKAFINNNGSDPELSESPKKAVVSFKMAEETPMDVYTDVMEEIRKAQPGRIIYHSPKQNPPAPPKPAEKLSEQNILRILVNREGLILADAKPISIDKLTATVKEFITNNGANPELSDSPEKAILAIKPSAKTPHEVFSKVYDEIIKAYAQAKDDAAQAEFGKNFEELEDGSAAKRRIDKMYPARISIQKPDNPKF